MVSVPHVSGSGVVIRHGMSSSFKHDRSWQHTTEQPPWATVEALSSMNAYKAVVLEWELQYGLKGMVHKAAGIPGLCGG